LNGKKLGAIFNNDNNNILCAMDGGNTAPHDYQRAVYAILDSRPGVLAQNVGMPDAVIYPSEVATTFEKYLVEVSDMVWQEDGVSAAERQKDAMERLLESGTDPFSLTIEACRKRGIAVVASYRMNAEDWYENTFRLSDFGRAHPDWRIPLTEEEKQARAKEGVSPAEMTGAMDPAVKDVYRHRMDIFSEVARNYDIDGIEFDFRRWYHMISRPLENYSILTQMLRDTRRMLDETSRRKGRDRMILGVRVGPSIDMEAEPDEKIFPGISFPRKPTNASCRELGLDVKTWIEDELVDYVCPSLFWPRWPGLPKTREFVELARDSKVGVFPTLFPLPRWLEKGSDKGPIALDDTEKLLRYKNEFCRLALNLYEDGADGVSTYNWYFHLRIAKVPYLWCEYYGYGPGGDRVQARMLSILNDKDAIQRYLNEPHA